VSLGLVRRTVRERLFVRPGRAVAAIAAVAVLAAGCSNAPLSGPSDAKLAGLADGRASLPSGLEQRLTTKVETPPPGSPYTALLTATSTLVNTGSSPIHVAARTCLVTEADVETTARMDRFEPFVACAAVSMEMDLAPGQSIGPLEVHFGVRSGPGAYTLKLRHSLSPDFRAEASFRIPERRA
jgi:hypothetical protein